MPSPLLLPLSGRPLFSYPAAPFRLPPPAPPCPFRLSSFCSARACRQTAWTMTAALGS